MDFQLNESQRLLKRTVRELSEKEFKPMAAYWDEHEEPPLPNVKKLADAGLIGAIVPEEYGGIGADAMDAVIIIEEVCRCCANTGVISAHQNGAPVRGLVHFGTEDQKRKYLPELVSGNKLLAWAMTEPEAGSDIVSLRTNAVTDGNHFVLNGSKVFCTLGGIAEVFLVLLRFDGVAGKNGIGAVIVERGTPGFIISKNESSMGMRGAATVTLFFEDCRIPRENLLLPAGNLRKLLQVMDADRALSGPVIALGVAQGAFEEAVKYARERRQFGRPIADFQGLRWMLADMAIKLEAARLLIYRAATNAALGFPSILESSVAKTFTSETAIEVTNMAIQILGGYGFSREYPVERMFRDARGWSIAGGTVQIQRNAIANEILGS